jgi:hypothetical protein
VCNSYLQLDEHRAAKHPIVEFECDECETVCNSYLQLEQHCDAKHRVQSDDIFTETLNGITFIFKIPKSVKIKEPVNVTVQGISIVLKPSVQVQLPGSRWTGFFP